SIIMESLVDSLSSLTVVADSSSLCKYDDDELPDYYDVLEKECEFEIPMESIKDRLSSLPKAEFISIAHTCDGFDWRVKMTIDAEGDIWVLPVIQPSHSTRFWTLSANFSVVGVGFKEDDKPCVEEKINCDEKISVEKPFKLSSITEITNLKMSGEENAKFKATFSPISSDGVSPRRRWPISDKTNPLADTRVYVGRKSLAIPMQYLSMYSEYFRSFGYDDCAGRTIQVDGKKHYVIEGVTYDEFYQWLLVRMPGSHSICRENAELVLKASKALEAISTVEIVDDYLIKDKELSTAYKFMLMIRYDLKKMKAKLDATLAKNDYLAILHSEEYKRFKSSEKLALMECIQRTTKSEFPKVAPAAS
ncbi:hypothetical protein PFISCL1PPCAC_8188, partial [Pristionchus fissidentatus]